MATCSSHPSVRTMVGEQMLGAQKLGKLDEIGQDSWSPLMSWDSVDGHALTFLSPIGGRTAPLLQPSLGPLPCHSLPAAQLDGGP